VEVVAELNDFVRSVAKNYPQIDPREIRVVLVHSQDRILPEVSRKLGEFAQRILRKRGVELLLNARLSAATGEEAVLGDGKTIPARTLVSTVPSFAHTLIEALPVPKSKGSRVRVTPELQVEGLGNVWAVNGATPPGAKNFHASMVSPFVVRRGTAPIASGSPRPGWAMARRGRQTLRSAPGPGAGT